MRVAPALFAVAACQSGGVLELEVTAPADPGVSITSVELFAGMTDKDTTAIQPDLPVAIGETIAWTRDRNPQADVVPMTDGSATFAFQLGGTDDQLGAIVAVGYDGMRPVAVATRLAKTAIPHDHAIDRYELPLVPAQALPALGGGPGLLVWGSPNDPRACVAVDNPSDPGDVGSKTAMIVTGDDPDCDGVTGALECRDHEFMGRDPIARSALQCVTHDAASFCVAGGPTCVDGRGTKPCEPSSYCMADVFCNVSCPALRCNVFDLTDANAIPHYQCSLQVNSNTQQACTEPAQLRLTDHFTTASCVDAPKLGDVMNDFSSNQIDFGNSSTLKIETVNPGTCAFKLSGSGPLQPIASTNLLIAYLSVPLAAPVAGRGMVLPIVITLEQSADCNASGITCQYVPAPGDSLPSCIAAPVTPGTVPSG